MISTAREALRLELVASTTPEVRERCGLLVIGMHRSGTSASTRILSLLGAELPANLMPSHAEFNAAGYWESLDVVALNEDLLAAAHSRWDDVLPVDLAQVPAEDLMRFQAGARAILERDFGESDWFVLKDPRIGRLLRPWVDAVRSTGARALVVIPVRHPVEVAGSLCRREGFAEEKSLYLWLRHMVDAIRSSRDVPRGIMLYDELMRDWRSSVDRLAGELGIHWPRQLDEVAEEAEKFLDPGLRHHELQDASGRHGLVARRALELYDALCRRAPELDELADLIHSELAPMEALFAPLQRDSLRKEKLAAEERSRLEQVVAGAMKEIEDKGRHVQVLEAAREDMESQRDRALEVIRERDATLEAVRNTHEQLSIDFEDKSRHVQLLMAELEDMRSQRDQALARVRELEEVLAKERAVAQSQLQELWHDLETARAAHAKVADAFEDKSRRVQLLDAELEDMRSQRDRGIARGRELEDVLARERAVAQSQQQELWRELETARAAQASAAAAFGEKSRHLALLEAELGEQLQALREELERACSAHAQVAEAFEDKSRHVEALKGRLSELQEQRDTAIRTIEEKASHLALAELAGRDLQARHAHAEARIGELEQTLQRAHEEHARQDADIEAMLEQLRQALEARHGSRTH